MSVTGRLLIHFPSLASECRVMSSFPVNTDGKIKGETNQNQLEKQGLIFDHPRNLLNLGT